MMNYIHKTWGVFAKDIRLWQRDWQATLSPMLMPLALLLICTVLFGFGGDEWNIALINEGSGPEATAFAATIENLQSTVSPYYRIITRDPDESRDLVDSGRLHMMITIPADFDDKLAAGETPTIQTRVFNINTDMTKNVRLRLSRALQDYLVATGRAPMTIAQELLLVHDVLRSAFIAGGAVIISVLVGASLNTAIVVAREWEFGTLKEVRLAPDGIPAIVTGKLLVGLVTTTVSVGLTLLVAMLLFQLRISPDRWLPLIAIGLIVSLASAGLGMAIGAILHDYRMIQPLLLVLAAGSFFAAGGYASVATLPPTVRVLNRFWPPSYVFETMHGLMHSAVRPDIGYLFIPFICVALLCIGFGWWSLRRALLHA